MRAGQGPLKPGGTDTVSVYVDTSGRNGELVKTVRVLTNDADNRAVILVIKAVIELP